MSSAERCAIELLQTIPALMQAIRVETRAQNAREFSVPQIRTLIYIYRMPGSPLKDVAEFIGVSLPSMSKLVDGLVQRGYVERAADADDRRKVALSLSPKGQEAMRAGRARTVAAMKRKLKNAATDDLERICDGLAVLRELFHIECLPERREKSGA